MKNSIIVLLVLLGQNQLLTAQTNVEKIITGTVISDAKKLEGISVINCMNKMMAVTDKDGCFSIQAKEGDILNFSGIDYKYLKKYVYRHEYNSGTMEVDMVFNAVELDEVIINKVANISAENLGIIPRGQVKFTPQERRLYSNSGGIQGLFSSISGDKEVLKMNVEIEKKELLLKKIEYLFGNKYYTKTLKIPEELIKGFQYYCVEDTEFVESLSLKNKTMSMFLMTNLASVYNRKRVSEE
ncbi:carboxypeptidase-like regulatory domain-containing protein [Flavobacterium taihuense]|uniref:Carboxypeptidase-like regulatory domain-containing protein n=1 Tax=Flavobacterium taihuense TaxID=2857508 RepID=A0ABS6XUY8_9FLAO|nr:carboxypeptidase-like regulatory domain-containing protein [Flavobacterium taihuense]MBW4359689.1 carboxypeptidase-like regulatory domain-containing protein [Flavobacterium taihuense]